MFIAQRLEPPASSAKNNTRSCSYKHVAPNGAKSSELLTKSFELILVTSFELIVIQWSSSHRVLNKFVDISMQFSK